MAADLEIQKLSQTLTSPLKKYLDGLVRDSFRSKIAELAAAFNVAETEVLNVVLHGHHQIKKAPARRAPAAHVTVAPPPPEPAVQAPPEPAAPKPAKLQKVKPSAPPETKEGEDTSCCHWIKGANARRCDKKGVVEVDGRWLCKKHSKKATKSVPPPPKKPEAKPKSLAKKISKQKKKALLDAKPAVTLVEMNGRYVWKEHNICFDPATGTAIGALHEDGRSLEQLSDAQLEVLAYTNTRYVQPSEEAAGGAPSGDESEEELVLEDSDED